MFFSHTFPIKRRKEGNAEENIFILLKLYYYVGTRLFSKNLRSQYEQPNYIKYYVDVEIKMLGIIFKSQETSHPGLDLKLKLINFLDPREYEYDPIDYPNSILRTL